MQIKGHTRTISFALAFLLIPVVAVAIQARDDKNHFSLTTATHAAGSRTIGPVTDSGNQAGISATQVTTGKIAGLLRSISVYVGAVQAAPHNHMQVAIYADNGANAPGELLVASRTQIPTARSWNKFPMNSIEISADAKYWLGFNVDGKDTQYHMTYNAGRVAWKIPTPFGKWPTLFGVPTQPMETKQYSIYMNYSTTDVTVPHPPPTRTNTPTATPPSTPSATPSATPSTAPTPSATPTSAPSARGCPLPDYPKPSCTGVPPGTRLTDLALNVENDAYRVTQDGTVLDAVHIPGILIISANNVTVKNSLIDGSIINEPQQGVIYKNLMVIDTTIGPTSGCFTALAGVSETNYTAIRVLVQHHEDGFWIAGPGNVTVRDSYSKGCAKPDGSSHSDGIQAVCFINPCTGLVFDHNTIDLIGVDATFPIHNGGPGTSTFTVTNNLVGGGAYTIVTEWKAGPNWQIKNNKIVDKAWVYGPTSAENTCAHQDWSGNQIVTIDSNYNITSVVRDQPCVD